MLTKTSYSVDSLLLAKAADAVKTSNFRTTINQPTGSFFYDPWEIKQEYKGTVWEELLSTIKEPVGEARFIVLSPQASYHVHSDIDDRFHLNLTGEESYLIDFTDNKLHKLDPDGQWYYMDAGRRHTASNFGRTDRVQFVVRKLLVRPDIINPTHVKIVSNIPSVDDSRFIFDNTVSPWLNRANKRRIIDNFKHTETSVELDIESVWLDELKSVLGNNFRITE